MAGINAILSRFDSIHAELAPIKMKPASGDGLAELAGAAAAAEPSTLKESAESGQAEGHAEGAGEGKLDTVCLSFTFHFLQSLRIHSHKKQKGSINLELNTMTCTRNTEPHTNNLQTHHNFP